MSENSIDYRRHALRQLAESFAATMAQYERTIAILEAELAASFHTERRTGADSGPASSKGPQIDRQLLSVISGKRRCFLGNTISFRLLERLLRRPNQYVSLDELRADVWRSHPSREAIRSAVKVLRRQLRQARMESLAAAIVGRTIGHYAIILGSSL